VLDEQGFGDQGTCGPPGTSRAGRLSPADAEKQDGQIAHRTILPSRDTDRRTLTNFGIRHTHKTVSMFIRYNITSCLRQKSRQLQKMAEHLAAQPTKQEDTKVVELKPRKAASR